MRIEEVPQDLKYCKDAVVRDQNYAVDNDGRYHMVKSDGWTAKNDALDLALEEDVDKEERSRMTLQTADIFEGTELDISHQPAAHCENGAISTLLRYYGIELSEPMIFGLASGLFFTHLTFVKMGGMPVTSFRTFPGVLFKRITKLFGIKSRTQRFFSHKAAMKKLDELILHKQTPVGCVVGMYELPYMPKEYRFRFNGHNICITGKDESRKLYRVLDSNATQKVTISAEDLAKVRFPAGGVYPLMGQMYWIESLPKHLPDLKPLILKSIHKTCWYMVSQPKFIKYVGTNGILYLSQRIRNWDTVMGKRRALLNLAQVVRMLEEIGTGGAGFRFMYGAFLQEAADITGISELNDYCLRITDIGDLWRDFAYKASRIIKGRSIKSHPSSLEDGRIATELGETRERSSKSQYTYNDLGDLLQDISEKERILFLELDKTVRSYM